MYSRSTFVSFLCFIILTASSGGKPQNSSIKPTADKPKAAQSFVVNNNCGLAKGESETLAYIKAKVDYIATKSKGPVCSEGWVLHGSSCFLVIDIRTLEWNDARRNCQKLGGDLAKITSAAENQFIYDLLAKQNKTGNAWLGLHRKANKKFYWVDDTPLTHYTAWDSPEPNNSWGNENCVFMYGKGSAPRPSAKGRWNDSPCKFNSVAQKVPVVLCKKQFN